MSPLSLGPHQRRFHVFARMELPCSYDGVASLSCNLQKSQKPIPALPSWPHIPTFWYLVGRFHWPSQSNTPLKASSSCLADPIIIKGHTALLLNDDRVPKALGSGNSHRPRWNAWPDLNDACKLPNTSPPGCDLMLALSGPNPPPPYRQEAGRLRKGGWVPSGVAWHVETRRWE